MGLELLRLTGVNEPALMSGTLSRVEPPLVATNVCRCPSVERAKTG
jgi:hypothetical protein